MDEKERKRRLNGISEYYESGVLKIPLDAERAHELNNSKNVAGQIRHSKGNLVEEIAKELVFLACDDLKISRSRCRLTKGPVIIKIVNSSYVMTRDLSNPDDIECELELDNLLTVDGKLIMDIESKSYTEASMLKRIMMESYMVYQHYPNTAFVVLQLENALDGNYDVDTNGSDTGSGSAHVIMSVFPDVHLNILTLLDGNRSSIKPIHDPKYYKLMNKDKLRKAYSTIRKLIDERVQKDRVVSQKRVYLHDYEMDDTYKVIRRRSTTDKKVTNVS